MQQRHDAGTVAPPRIAQTVHYMSYGTPVQPDGSQAYPSVCRAAIVTAVDTYQDSEADGVHVGHVSLCVLNPDGMFFNRAVFRDEDHRRGGTWHLPCDEQPPPISGLGRASSGR